MHTELSFCLLKLQTVHRGVVVYLKSNWRVKHISGREVCVCVCVKTYDSSRGLSSGASSPFVKLRMDSASLHCARQNGFSGAWQREVFFCAVGFGSGDVHSTASAARCLSARCYGNRTRSASENNFVLNENLLCANGGKIGGGRGRGEGGKERKEWGAWISNTCLELLRHTGEISKVLLRFFFLLWLIDLKIFLNIFDLCYMSPYKNWDNFLQKFPIPSGKHHSRPLISKCNIM